MAQKIADCNLECTIQKVYQDEEVEEKAVVSGDEEEGEPLDLDEIMADLQTPLNMKDNSHQVMNESYFSLQVKDHYKVYTFKNKNITSFYNILANFVGDCFKNQNTQIIADFPFINCTYNESTEIFKGPTSEKEK